MDLEQNESMDIELNQETQNIKNQLKIFSENRYVYVHVSRFRSDKNFSLDFSLQSS